MAKKLLSRKSKLAETFLPSSRKNSVERSRNHEVISDHNTKKKQRPFTSHSNSTTIKKRTRPSRRIINDDPKRKQMVEKHRSSNTFSEEIMPKPNQSKVIKKFDTEETPTSSHGKTSEVKLNDVSMKGEQTNPDPMQPSTGWVGENQATDSAALAKMMSQLSGEVLRTSVQQKAELQKEIDKERSEIKEEWNRLKQKIQEEHEEREKFNQIKNEELQKIDEKKREIEEIAKNIENTNKIILKQKEELEREKEDLKKAREESNHNSSQVKYKDVEYNGEKKIHPQAQRIKEQEVHFKKPPRKKSEEKEDTFADKVENQVNKTNKKLSESHKNDIGEISPVNDDPSISSRKLSPNYQAQINDQEVEVPLDFEDNKMAKDTTSEDENKDVLDDNQIDKIIAEDTALYDASLFFDEQIFDFREKKAQYKIFKVIQTDNPDIGHVIVGSEIVEKDDIIHLRLFCFKDKGEDLDNCEEHVIPLDSIRAMMKLISSKDVLPHNKPIKTTRNYKEFISRFLFSFLAYKKDNDNPNGSESIQIKSNTKGILKREIHVKFCGKECSICLHYIEDKTFRLTFYVKMNTSEFGQGASIDLKFDEASFNKYFSNYDVEEMIQRHPNLESSLLPESSQDNEAKEKNRNRTIKELFIPTYELLDDELIKELKNPVKELERYGRKYYSNSINSFIYGEQKNHLITQVRFSVDPLFNHDPQTDPEPKKELWVVRNDARNGKFIYTCKTLYKMQLSPEKNTSVEETFEVPHSHLWKYFGVEYRNCDQSDIKMFASMLLDLMKLDTPTLNKGTKCSDPDGQEEKVFISIKKPQTVCNSRHIIEVKKQCIPLTLSLISNDKEFLGIKACTFDRATRMERGVFLRVTSDDWKYDEEYIKSLPRSSQKYPLKHFYSLVELLEERGMMNLNPEEESNAIIESQVSKFPKIRSSEDTPPGVDTPSGFEVIFHSLQFNQERVPSIENIFGEWTYVDSFNKSDYV